MAAAAVAAGCLLEKKKVEDNRIFLLIFPFPYYLLYVAKGVNRRASKYKTYNRKVNILAETPRKPERNMPFVVVTEQESFPSELTRLQHFLFA